MITNGSGEGQRAKIERFDLARHFDHFFIEGELGYGKPDRRVYLGAMAALGSEPAETWCVGDNLEWEVAAPQRLGIYGRVGRPVGGGPAAGLRHHPRTASCPRSRSLGSECRDSFSGPASPARVVYTGGRFGRGDRFERGEEAQLSTA